MVAIVLVLAGCSSSAPSTDDISHNVKSSMQSYFDTTDNVKGYHCQVMDVALVKASDNTYNGVATVSPLKGPTGKVAITVTYDGQNAMWQAPPGAMLFLMRATDTSTSTP